MKVYWSEQLQRVVTIPLNDEPERYPCLADRSTRKRCGIFSTTRGGGHICPYAYGCEVAPEAYGRPEQMRALVPLDQEA